MAEKMPYGKVYFVGIGGVGMSGLAQILRSRGVTVVGSDPGSNAATRRLEEGGTRIYTQQIPENIDKESPDLVVMTAAVQEDHPEVAAALGKGIPVVSRAAFLGQIMADSGGPRIAITGTHGKTTTTSMIATILIEAGLDPNVLVGGEFTQMGGNVRVGEGLFLTEACEAYDSFLELRPDIAVITNVEVDHLDYYGTAERMFESFHKFLDRIPRNGVVVTCADDPGVARLLKKHPNVNGLTTVLYGIETSDPNALRAESVTESGVLQSFRALRGQELGLVKLRVPGRHNVLNALAAVAVGLELGVEFRVIAEALGSYRGAGRRFEILGERDGITVIDDYAHHPTEVRATISAARAAFPERRIVVAFQPHLYSRTRDFLQEFAAALNGADSVVVADIYAAREKPIDGVRSTDLVRALASLEYEKTVLHAAGTSEAAEALAWIAREGDVVITMGAGDIDETAQRFLEARRKAA